MTLPYIARLVCLVGNEPVELKRFRRRPFPSDLRYWFEGRENRCWVEQPLGNTETITPRWEPAISHEAHRQRAAHALAHKGK